MNWSEQPLLAFDTETTGPDPLDARIVTATTVVVNDGPPATTEWLADPGIDIPAGATAVHGITTEHARANGRPAADVVIELDAMLNAAWLLGQPVLAYNACYDLTVLDGELQRHHGRRLVIAGPVIDPLVIDKAVDRYRKGKRTLTAACEHYRVTLTDAHTSAADALGAARVAWRICQRHREIAEMDPTELHELQVGWYRQQAEGLAAYFARQGKTETVSTEWPLRHAEQEAAAS